MSIYYEYEKSDGAITVSQLFGFRDEKINELLLVFDVSKFV